MLPLAGLAALLGLACATWLDSVDVDVEQADGFEPKAVKTWAWVDPPEPEGAAPGEGREDARLVRAFVRQELAGKGYREKPADEADAWVSYHVVIEGAARRDSLAEGRRAMAPPSWADALEYRAGTLYLGLLEPHTRERLWVGSADGYTRDDPAMVQVVVERLVKAIFAKLPDATAL